MMKTQDLIGKFRQALKEHWGYIWGTAGEPWTEAKQKALEKTTDPDRAQGREYGSKWIGHTVADCSGLFSWAFRQLGGYMYHGSDTMYRKYCVNKGELKKGKRTDSAALKPGTAVFVWNGKKYSHVGLYIGDGTVIEAMGTMSGVTTSKVTAGKWTHWGELNGVDYSSDSPAGGNTSPGVIPEESLSGGKRPTLRKGDKGEAVREMQAMLDRLEKLEEKVDKHNNVVERMYRLEEQVKNLQALFNIFPSVTQNLVGQLLNQVLTFLGLIGVIVDPTTAGYGDSERALAAYGVLSFLTGSGTRSVSSGMVCPAPIPQSRSAQRALLALQPAACLD